MVTKCRSQKTAIADAKKHVTEMADQFGIEQVAHVLLASGDTLTITANPEGKLSSSKGSGWVRHGDVFCGPKAYRVAQ